MSGDLTFSVEITPNPATADGGDHDDDANFDPLSLGLTQGEVDAIDQAFELVDTDGSGEMELPELEALLSELGISMTTEDAKSLLDRIDAMHGTLTGTVTRREFLEWWSSNQTSKEFAGLKAEIKNRMKASAAKPFQILVHLFDTPSWFLQMGKKGYPLFVAAEIIQWTVIVLIILSTIAFVVLNPVKL